MGLLLACMYLHCLHSASRGQKSVRSPGIGVTDGCVIQHVSAEEQTFLPLQEQSMLLTTEPLLQSPKNTFLIKRKISSINKTLNLSRELKLSSTV